MSNVQYTVYILYYTILYILLWSVISVGRNEHGLIVMIILGLQSAESIYSRPGTAEGPSGRLLEDDMGAKRGCDCHDH